MLRLKISLFAAQSGLKPFTHNLSSHNNNKIKSAFSQLRAKALHTQSRRTNNKIRGRFNLESKNVDSSTKSEPTLF